VLTKASQSQRKPKHHSPDLAHLVRDEVWQMPETIELEMAKGSHLEPLWNGIVNRYHYLGHKVQVGRCLKYLIRGDGQILGAISFSSPAWKLASRDKVLAHLGLPALRTRDSLISNTRFLLLPNVRVAHLASRILSLATKRVAADWEAFYSVTPLMAETFVEPTRFRGVCYRAANWVHIGSTSGFSKAGASHHNSQIPKDIFLYGLTRPIRRKLITVGAILPEPCKAKRH
jgi:hypothetical protein